MSGTIRVKPLFGTDDLQACAYVCSDACVHRTYSSATVTFEEAWRDRPQGCRYLIGRQCDITQTEYQYVVWDMFEAQKDPNLNVYAPKPRWVHPSLEVAIVATLMLYGKEAAHG